MRGSSTSPTSPTSPTGGHIGSGVVPVSEWEIGSAIDGLTLTVDLPLAVFGRFVAHSSVAAFFEPVRDEARVLRSSSHALKGELG